MGPRRRAVLAPDRLSGWCRQCGRTLARLLADNFSLLTLRHLPPARLAQLLVTPSGLPAPRAAPFKMSFAERPQPAPGPDSGRALLRAGHRAVRRRAALFSAACSSLFSAPGVLDDRILRRHADPDPDFRPDEFGAAQGFRHPPYGSPACADHRSGGLELLLPLFIISRCSKRTSSISILTRKAGRWPATVHCNPFAPHG